MKFLIAVLFLFASPLAFAANNNNGPQGGNASANVGVGVDVDASSRSSSSSTAVAASSSTSAAVSGAISGSVAGGGSSDASSSSSSGGNSLTVNEAASRHAASTPATVVGNTTASCRVFIGLSGMGREGGGGLGIPLQDKDCVHVTLANAALLQGNKAVAAQLLCTAPTIRKVVGTEACLASQ